MTKRRLAFLFCGVVAALLLAGLVGVSVVSAQEPTPPASPGAGGDRHGGLLGARGGAWTAFDAAAEALGLTPEELFAELHDGKRLEEVAEAHGVDMEAVREAVQAARLEARKAAIQQAVEGGKLTQEQADWLIEGIEKGFFPKGRGLRGRAGGRGGASKPADV